MFPFPLEAAKKMRAAVCLEDDQLLRQNTHPCETGGCIAEAVKTVVRPRNFLGWIWQVLHDESLQRKEPGAIFAVSCLPFVLDRFLPDTSS